MLTEIHNNKKNTGLLQKNTQQSFGFRCKHHKHPLDVLPKSKNNLWISTRIHRNPHFFTEPHTNHPDFNKSPPTSTGFWAKLTQSIWFLPRSTRISTIRRLILVVQSLGTTLVSLWKLREPSDDPDIPLEAWRTQVRPWYPSGSSGGPGTTLVSLWKLREPRGDPDRPLEAGEPRDDPDIHQNPLEFDKNQPKPIEFRQKSTKIRRMLTNIHQNPPDLTKINNNTNNNNNNNNRLMFPKSTAKTLT